MFAKIILNGNEIILNEKHHYVPPNVDWDKSYITYTFEKKRKVPRFDDVVRLVNLEKWIKEIQTWENIQDKRILIKDINRRIKEIKNDIYIYV